MPICKDPLATHLRKLGMNFVYPPRANLAPLELMLKQNKHLSRWGDAKKAFHSSEPVPEINENITVNSIQKDITASHDLSIGLSILGSVLGEVGASLGLKSAYKNAKKLKFTYENISSDYADPQDIDIFINSSALNSNAVSTAEYLQSDSLYIVSEVFKSNKIRVEAQDESGVSLNVEIPKITQIGEVDLNITHDTTDNTIMVYEGSVPVTFGIRALKIDYVSKGNKSIYKLIKAKSSFRAKSLGMSAASLDVVSYESLEDNDIRFVE